MAKMGPKTLDNALKTLQLTCNHHIFQLAKSPPCTYHYSMKTLFELHDCMLTYETHIFHRNMYSILFDSIQPAR